MNLRFNGRALVAAIALCLLALLALASAAFAASGDLAWHRSFNGAGNGQDSFNSLAVAPGGGAYVAGMTVTTTTSFDFVAARYDTAGQRHWQHTYNGPGDGLDWFGAAASDRQGDLIEAGYVTTAADTLVTGIVKYDAAGHLRWVRFHNVVTGVPDNPLAITTDARGNVYVASTEGSSSYDIVVLKYSPSGIHRWTTRYAGPAADIPTDIALDRAGNVYVAGYSYQGTTRGYDALTLKVDPRGHRRWARLFDGPSISDVGDALAVTKTGTVYVGGSTIGATSSGDALLLKYVTNGALRWHRTYTGAGANTDGYADVALLPNGDVAATGYSFVANLADALLTRYQPSGNRRWVRVYDGPDSSNDQGIRVARGQAGAIYVAGDTTANATGGDALLLKYSGGGALRWARSYSGTGTGNDYAAALVTVPVKSVYVAGQQQSSTVSDGFVLRYKP